MCKGIYFAAAFVCVALLPATKAFAQHCQPYWTAQYRCAMGCGCGGNATRQPYVAPQPSAAQIAAQRAHALNDAGNNAYAAKNWALAISLYTQALRLAPNDTAIARNLRGAHGAQINAEGIKAGRAKNWPLAVKLFEQALRTGAANAVSKRTMEKNLVESLNAQGLDAVGAGDLALATKLFERALQVAPKDKSYAPERNVLRKNIADARARMQEQAKLDEQKRRQQSVQTRVVGTAQSIPAKNASHEWVCPPDLPQIAFNSARINQPDGHYCIGKNAVACGGPTKSWACEAGHSCNGDGSDPKVDPCR